ncbi:hypothetical protein NQ318_015682 [Aromia moschata]|uniref:RNA-directed DNA polymerase n=1 Tax=Aromia moschata TaxID=1265417 RepID=A0AAV8YH78_9CUCU|nr:hypothetical protein NQ318_015682 [Aromia moschata]
MVAPINDLIKNKKGKRHPIKWNDQAEQAFKTIKEALTLRRIGEEFYWPRMRQDILRYIKSCRICNSQKVPFSRYGLMGAEKKVEFPWQVVCADIWGPVPRNWFTKYVLVHPMRKATAQAVTKFMENEVFLVYGVPQFVIVDNGKQFACRLFKDLAERYKVQKIWFNAKFHPQTNPVERCNATIGAAIRSYVNDNQQDWDLEIHRVAHAIRTATHEVTGFPPTFLNFGRKVPISGDYYGQVNSTEGIQLAPGDRNNYSEDLANLPELYRTVKQRLHESYQKSRQRYNLRRREVTYEVGDKVWKRNKVLSNAANNFSAKLAPKYVLCTVRQRLSKVVYALNYENGKDAGSWHVSDMKPYYGSNSDVSVG